MNTFKVIYCHWAHAHPGAALVFSQGCLLNPKWTPYFAEVFAKLCAWEMSVLAACRTFTPTYPTVSTCPELAEWHTFWESFTNPLMGSETTSVEREELGENLP